MTYAELKSLIQDYTQNTESQFVADLPTFIQQTEERILKTIQLPVFRKNVSGTLTSGNEYLSTPSDFLDNFSLSFTSSGSQIFLLFKDVNFIREAYPNSSTTGTPKHYALFDDGTFIIGPTPDSSYAVELHYFYRPVSLTAGADDGTTWLSDNAENAMLYGSLLEAYIYMKGEADLITLYQQRFMEALARLKNLGEGDNTVDDYRDDVVRIKRT
jgi:hypothetical protein